MQEVLKEEFTEKSKGKHSEEVGGRRKWKRKKKKYLKATEDESPQ